MKLLHLDSSIQGDASVTRTVSAAVVKQLRADNPDLNVSYRDLATNPVDHLTFAGLGGIEAATLLEEFLVADIVVIGAPLYNFTIPSQLKAWIDRIVSKGKTFRYGEHGSEGLAGGKRVIFALSRGGVYSKGSPIAADEHAETLLRTVLGFIGINDPQFIVAEGVDLGSDERRVALAAAITQAGRIAPALA